MSGTPATDASTLNRDSERSLQLARAAARTAADNRGQDILILDLRDLTPIFDYFVIATGTSRRQLHAMSEEIDHTLEDELGATHPRARILTRGRLLDPFAHPGDSASAAGRKRRDPTS